MSKRPRIAVSDHALVRFCERVAGVDLEPVRSAIAQVLDRAYQTAEVLELEEYSIKSAGKIYHVKHGVVVTVLDDKLVVHRQEDRNGT